MVGTHYSYLMEHPILMAVRNAGFSPLGWFYPTAQDAVPSLADGSSCQFVLLIGNAGPNMFARFSREKDPQRHLLDSWTQRVLGELAEDLGAHALYPFGGPPFWPILTWAKRAGAGFQSPLGMNIHPTYGLWHAYRAAFLFPVAFDLPKISSANPCQTCKDQPCLSACPVHAFRDQAYDVAGCATHVNSQSGQTCRDGGCLSRHACPIGQGFAYSPAQAQFHMRAFLKARNED